MKKIIYLFLFAFLSFQNFTCSAQIDTSFWFAAPWITPDHWWRDDIKLHISTFNSPSTTVRLRQPGAIAPNKYDTTIIIGPNSTFDYVFWRDKLATLTNIGYDSLETRPADVVVPYGLYISASSNITVVYDVITRAPNYFNPETFSLKGRNALGTHFICPFQTKQNNQALGNLAGTPPGTMQPKSQINIVATKANTTVSITPKCNVVGHLANVTYTIILNNPGDAYTIENAVQTSSIAANNLSGTEITSNNPIAVTVADDSMKGVTGCFDLIGDQIVPTNVTGKDHIIIKGFLNAPDNEGAFILGTQNNTFLTINDGMATTFTIVNKGDTYFYKATQDLSYINSDKPVYCLQLTGFGCEYGSDIVAPLNCSGSNLVSFSRNTVQNFYLHLLCKNGLQSFFTLNNAISTVTVPITAANFTMVPGTATLSGGPYYGARINLTPLAALPVGSYTIANVLDVFALGVFEGGASTGGLFHHMSSFQQPNSVAVGSSYSICANTNSVISLSGTVSGVANTGVWTTPNGTGTFGAYTSTVNTIATSYTLSPADQLLSNIKFYLTSTGGCSPKKDSVIVTLIPLPQITITPGSSICSTNTNVIALSSTLTNATSGIWTSSGTGLFLPSNAAPNASYSPSSGDLSFPTFTLTCSVASLCGSTFANAVYTVITSPTVIATTSNSLICVGQNATLTASGANTYSWNTTSTNTSIVVSPIVTTGYSVIGIISGCSNTYTFTVSVSPCTGIDGVVINNDLLKIYPNPNNGEFTISAATDLKLILVNELGQLVKNITLTSSNNRTTSITHLANGIYFVTGKVDGQNINQKIVVAK